MNSHNVRSFLVCFLSGYLLFFTLGPLFGFLVAGIMVNKLFPVSKLDPRRRLQPLRSPIQGLSLNGWNNLQCVCLPNLFGISTTVVSVNWLGVSLADASAVMLVSTISVGKIAKYKLPKATSNLK